jgi:hypothetical protein
MPTTRIYDDSIKKVALLFCAHGGRYLAENVAVDLQDGHKRGRDDKAYDKTNPPVTKMSAAGIQIRPGSIRGMNPKNFSVEPKRLFGYIRCQEVNMRKNITYQALLAFLNIQSAAFARQQSAPILPE